MVKPGLSGELVSHTDDQTWPFILQLVTKQFLNNEDDEHKGFSSL